MRIGIVTHQLLNNYGGILQAYALQESLRKLGHEPITIDYLPESMSKTRYVLAQIKTLFYYLIFKRTRVFFRYPHKKRDPRISNFILKHIKLTKRVQKYQASILRKYQIETIIVGSDQVWRGAFYNPKVQADLFLRFAKKYHVPKIAYAASFGVDKWEYSDKLTQECAKYAKKFTAISTREDSGVILCKKYLHVDAIGVNDPTLLLTKEDYAQLCTSIPIKKQKYILAYILDIQDEEIKKIGDFARKNHLFVIFCTSEKHIEYSIEEWLSLFRDATFVITNSFHGTVFSIINNKDFYSIVHPFRGTDRFNSLLSRFNLLNRLINNIEELPNDIKSIEWSNVNSLKDEWNKKSLLFLNNNLNIH